MHNVYFFIAGLRDPFNTITSGSIHIDPVDIAKSYVSKTWALLEKQIWEVGGRDNVKASITQKIFFVNEKSGEVHSYYLQTEMQTLHPVLHNSEAVFLDWVVMFFIGWKIKIKWEWTSILWKI